MQTEKKNPELNFKAKEVEVAKATPAVVTIFNDAHLDEEKDFDILTQLRKKEKEKMRLEKKEYQEDVILKIALDKYPGGFELWQMILSYYEVLRTMTIREHLENKLNSMVTANKLIMVKKKYIHPDHFIKLKTIAY